MNRLIKDATVKRYHYDSHNQPRTHLHLFVNGYNHARRLKTLRGLTLTEFVLNAWTNKPALQDQPVTLHPGTIQLGYKPPLWLHAVLTLPLTLLACAPIIQPLKGFFIANQYISKAEEGRFAVWKPIGPGPTTND